MICDATGTELVPGRLIAGRFRLERLLGRGGMGSVWVAHHLNLDVDVALKFIDTTVAQREDAAPRFAREAQAAARVQSPHVVNILDYGTDAFGRPYLAMELLRGEELAQRLVRRGRLPLADVGRVVVHACRGLGRAHAAGIVHRDLKPENLFLADDDEGFVAKVLDFGIAKAPSPVGAVTHQTDAGHILGTPLFMSPEQALGRGDVDFRSDLYSLAVVAFRCLTGEVPFASEALGELIVKITSEPAPSVRALRPDLPPAMDAWFRRALHKKPSKRFGSAREMAETFSRACGGLSDAYGGATPPPALPPGRPRGPGGEASATAPRGLETLMGTTSASPASRARPWGSYGVAALLGTLLFGLLPSFKHAKPEGAVARRRPPPSAVQAGRANSAPTANVAAPPPAASAARKASAPPPAPSPAPKPGASPAPNAFAALSPSPPSALAGRPAAAEAAKPAGSKRDAAIEGRGRQAPRAAPRHVRHAAPKPAPAKGAGPARNTTDWGL